MTVEQTDLMGEHTITVVGEKPKSPEVSWLPAARVKVEGVEKSLRMMGVPLTEDRTEGWALRAWRDEMIRRTRVEPAEFRRWLDLEVNFYGNEGLALFIWEIA